MKILQNSGDGLILHSPDLVSGVFEYRGVAQLASALAWGARGRKFESSHPDQIKKAGLPKADRPFFIPVALKACFHKRRG